MDCEFRADDEPFFGRNCHYMDRIGVFLLRWDLQLAESCGDAQEWESSLSRRAGCFAELHRAEKFQRSRPPREIPLPGPAQCTALGRLTTDSCCRSQTAVCPAGRRQGEAVPAAAFAAYPG